MEFRPSFKVSVALAVAGFLVFMLYLYFFVGFESMLKILEKVNPFEYFLYYSLTQA